MEWIYAHNLATAASQRLAAMGCPVASPVDVREYEVDAAYAGRWMENGLVIKPEALDWLMACADKAPPLAASLAPKAGRS